MALKEVEIINKDAFPELSNHTAVYVNEKVYVFGGFDGYSCRDSLCVLDIKKHLWEEVVELSKSKKPSPRQLHSMEVLSDSTIVIFGGKDEINYFNDTYILHTSTFRWEKINSKGPSERFGMGSAVSKETLVVVGGFGTLKGLNKELEDIWAFDNQTRRWRSIKAFGEEVPKGLNLKCWGTSKGVACLSEEMSKVFFLDLASEEWTVYNCVGKIPQLSKYSLVGFSDCCYVLGGTEETTVLKLECQSESYFWNEVECKGYKGPGVHSHSSVKIGESLVTLGGISDYRPTNRVLLFKPQLEVDLENLGAKGYCPSPRVGQATCYSNLLNSIIIHGGDSYGEPSNDFFLFTQERTWKKLYIKGTAPYLVHHSMVYDSETDKAYIFGGGNLKQCFNDLYEVDVKSQKIKLKSTKETVKPRAGHSAFIFQKRMVVIGGFVPKTGFSIEVCVLDLKSLVWTQVNPRAKEEVFPKGRSAMSCNFLNNCAFIIGGINSQEILSDTWKLDLETWQWEQIKLPGISPEPLYGHAAEFLGNKLYLFCPESHDHLGRHTKVPRSVTLWSLNSITHEWCKEIKGIPSKRFFSALKFQNSIWVYGGGPDPNTYLLTKKFIEKAIICTNLYEEVFPESPFIPEESKLESPDISIIKPEGHERKSFSIGTNDYSDDETLTLETSRKYSDSQSSVKSKTQEIISKIKKSMLAKMKLKKK